MVQNCHNDFIQLHKAGRFLTEDFLLEEDLRNEKKHMRICRCDSRSIKGNFLKLIMRQKKSWESWSFRSTWSFLLSSTSFCQKVASETGWPSGNEGMNFIPIKKSPNFLSFIQSFHSLREFLAPWKKPHGNRQSGLNPRTVPVQWNSRQTNRHTPGWRESDNSQPRWNCKDSSASFA